MFKREIKNIGDLIRQNMRNQGLETPLLQKRLIDAWPEVVGEVIARYTRVVRQEGDTFAGEKRKIFSSLFRPHLHFGSMGRQGNQKECHKGQ